MKLWYYNAIEVAILILVLVCWAAGLVLVEWLLIAIDIAVLVVHIRSTNSKRRRA